MPARPSTASVAAGTRGFIDEASFRLAKEAQPERQALVERLLAVMPGTGTLDPADPEQ